MKSTIEETASSQYIQSQFKAKCYVPNQFLSCNVNCRDLQYLFD